MKRSFIAQAMMMTLSLAFLVSCSPKSTAPSSWLQQLSDELGIFSNRPQTSDQFIGILKLKTPPLLASAASGQDSAKIDPAQLKLLLAEQEQAIKDLKALSPDIQVIYRYKMVLNGMAFVAPNSLMEKLKALATVSYVESEGNFGRPYFAANTAGDKQVGKEDILAANSVKFIGAEVLHEKGITGRGIKVGIIDTGIDYTHAMLGGPGTEEIYKSVDPAKANILFPNKKVVGGIDLVGTRYNSASGNFALHIPLPDENPLDEGGHGSHVAGTVAGRGDGINTYSGVAPEADLYAIKVFGAEGSTGDAVVIAALEYAADPSNQGTAEGRLDVVNLSLGSPWGAAHVLYGEAVKNLVAGGTIMVASAGNEGPVDYIVGAPSIIDEALSVAASVDNSTHNWQFGAVKFHTPTKGDLISEAVEGPISKPIAEAGPVTGKLVEAGIADAEFPIELKEKLKGNVALIARGKVAFADKVKRAFGAGAIGVVVTQNQPGAPFQMGGEGKFEIPAIMISQALGDTLREEMNSGDVSIEFQTSEKIQKPELIDTLTSFSSKGPRSIDGLLKPEISAPGANVISAAMGKGKAGVQFSGTSMAGPHIAGAMALLRQVLPALSPLELKAVAMGRSVSIADEKKVNYPVSQQGAGRIQIDRAATALVVADKPALSFGELNIESKKMVRQKVSIKNISKETQKLTVEFAAGSPWIKMTGPSQVTVAAGESVTLDLSFTLDASQVKETVREFDGLVKLMKDGAEAYRIPVLAVVHRISQVKALSLAVHSTSEADAAGSAADLILKNEGRNEGQAMIFNLLGKDTRKTAVNNDAYLSKACDMQAAGYRLVDKVVDGQKLKVLQVAVKLYEPLTSWNFCEVSVLIDANGDGIADQELAGVALGNVKGLAGAGQDNKFMSILLDAPAARKIRKDFELASAAASQKPKDETKEPATEDYSPALLDMQGMTNYSHSTIAIVEADSSMLARSATGELSIRVATIHNEASAAQMDDFLSKGKKEWAKLSIDGQSQAYRDIPESILLAAGETKNIELTKGEGHEGLLVLMPQNRTVFSDLLTDGQAQVVKAKFDLQ
jgi:minor extracellular serine protease Vpr